MTYQGISDSKTYDQTNYLKASNASVFSMSEQRETCDESIAWRLIPGWSQKYHVHGLTNRRFVEAFMHTMRGFVGYFINHSRSVGWSVTLLKISPKLYLNRINVPVHPYATDAVVYTAMF